MLDIVKKHLAAISLSNWNDCRATLATDAVFEDVPVRQRVQGAEQCIDAIRAWKATFPDLKATVTRGYAIGERVVCEVEWEGTQSGPLEGIFGTLPPTHKRSRVRAIIVFMLRGGKIIEARHFYDMLTVLNQLGVQPTVSNAKPGPRVEAVRL
jgi:steroid delta-isomerase-like uncharacterized protein